MTFDFSFGSFLYLIDWLGFTSSFDGVATSPIAG